MEETTYKAAVVVAGGSGKRMKAGIPKQFIMLKGKPILIHTLERFLRFDENLRLALVLPSSSINTWNGLAKQYLSPEDQQRIQVGKGGIERSDSVKVGLELLAQTISPPERCWVAIHDGVRPFIDATLLQNAFETAQKEGASVACVKVKSSVREILLDGQSRAVDRGRFLHVQTPQTFRLDQILQAHQQKPAGHFTDDASIYEVVVGPVAISSGSYSNIKITTPEDLPFAEQLLQKLHGDTPPIPVSHSNGRSSLGIKLLLVDIDGTMTDGGIYYSEKGEVFKKFNVKDGMGIHRLMKLHGIEVGFISSGATPNLVKSRAEKLGIQLYHCGGEPKVEVVDQWVRERNISYAEVAYVGDDLNDLALIRKVGLAASPSDAATEVKQNVQIVLKQKGGEGCIREFIEDVLAVKLSEV